MTISRRKFMALSGASAIGLVAAPYVARGQSWPARPITVVVGYSAGGGVDTIARAITGQMAKSRGWDINVINKPGAVGGVATSYVLNRPADGYTWFGISNYNKFVPIMGHADTRAWEDFQFYKSNDALAAWSVPVSSPFKTFDDVVKAAKERPGEITISTSGTGGIWHEMALIVAQTAGIDLKFTPYKGGQPATLAALQGEVEIGGGGVHEHIDLIRAGKFRNLMQTAAVDLKPKDADPLPSIGNFLPEIKPLLPLSANTNIAIRRDTPVEILKAVEEAFIEASNSEPFKEMLDAKFFQLNIRTGADADRDAALSMAVTAKTFWSVRDQIGQAVRSPEELGLPDPAKFDEWWPPEGYKARI